MQFYYNHLFKTFTQLPRLTAIYKEEVIYIKNKILSMFIAGLMLAVSGLAVFAQIPTATGTPTPTTTTSPTISPTTSPTETSGQVYTVVLNEVNGSGVSGQVTVTMQADGNLRVVMQASGLEDGQTHPQHIHGFANGTASQCPTMDMDENGDGAVSGDESESAVGPAIFDLTPYLSESEQNFDRTYTSGIEQVAPLDIRAIEIHGMTVDGQYQENTPVACGELTSGGQGGAPSDTTTDTTVETNEGTTTVPNGAPNTGFKCN